MARKQPTGQNGLTHKGRLFLKQRISPKHSLGIHLGPPWSHVLLALPSILHCPYRPSLMARWLMQLWLLYRKRTRVNWKSSESKNIEAFMSKPPVIISHNASLNLVPCIFWNRNYSFWNAGYWLASFWYLAPDPPLNSSLEQWWYNKICSDSIPVVNPCPRPRGCLSKTESGRESRGAHDDSDGIQRIVSFDSTGNYKVSAVCQAEYSMPRGHEGPSVLEKNKWVNLCTVSGAPSAPNTYLLSIVFIKMNNAWVILAIQEGEA